MKVAVLKETAPGETRVALVPSMVPELTRAGLAVEVEQGAGGRAGVSDADYREAGASIAPDAASAVRGAEVVLTVRGLPEGLDASVFAPGTAVLGFLAPLENVDGLSRLASLGATALAMETVPRTTRAQRMDALSSQASIAGYRAVLAGAERLPRFLPMMTTAAGTIRPSKVLVLGAGVAGLQAIATARRLGAVVEAFDVRPEVREQVQSLGARFLESEEEIAAVGTGGYATTLSTDQAARVTSLLEGAIPGADLVITTAQIPGRPAPRLVTDAMLASMRPGSVVVDLAASSGGNTEGVVPDGEAVAHGVLLLGPTNLPAGLAVHASQLYSRNVVALLLHLVAEGRLHLDLTDEISAGACVVHRGEIRHPGVRERLGLPALPSPPAPGS